MIKHNQGNLQKSLLGLWFQRTKVPHGRGRESMAGGSQRRKLSTSSCRHRKQRGDGEKRKWNKAMNSQSLPQEMFPSARPHLLNLHKQHYQLGTKYLRPRRDILIQTITAPNKSHPTLFSMYTLIFVAHIQFRVKVRLNLIKHSWIGNVAYFSILWNLWKRSYFFSTIRRFKRLGL